METGMTPADRKDIICSYNRIPFVGDETGGMLIGYMARWHVT
jgi:hypothetical protein